MPEFKNYEKKNSIHMESCLDILDSHHLHLHGYKRRKALQSAALDAGHRATLWAVCHKNSISWLQEMQGIRGAGPAQVKQRNHQYIIQLTNSSTQQRKERAAYTEAYKVAK